MWFCSIFSTFSPRFPPFSNFELLLLFFFHSFTGSIWSHTFQVDALILNTFFFFSFWLKMRCTFSSASAKTKDSEEENLRVNILLVWWPHSLYVCMRTHWESAQWTYYTNYNANIFVERGIDGERWRMMMEKNEQWF